MVHAAPTSPDALAAQLRATILAAAQRRNDPARAGVDWPETPFLQGLAAGLDAAPLPSGATVPVAFFVPPPSAARRGDEAHFAPPPSWGIQATFRHAVAQLDVRVRAQFERAFGGHLLGLDSSQATVFMAPDPGGAVRGTQERSDRRHQLALAYVERAGPAVDLMARILRQMLFPWAQPTGEAPSTEGPSSRAGHASQGDRYGQRLDQYLDRPNAFSEALDDPSLTVEDKVALAFMLILKRFTREIKDQMDRVNQLHMQNGSNNGSIDVEALKLSRLVTKKGNMADILRQILDKYNQTAKGVTDGIGR